MPATNLVVANRALTLLGETEIASLSGSDDISLTANSLYEPLVVSMFGKHRWRFAKTRVVLAEDTGNAPINRWTRAFLLPTLNTTRIGAPIAFYDSDDIARQPTTAYELVGARVETDHTALWCLYTKRQDETLWPESFARFVAHALASEMAEPITQQASLGDKFFVKAFGGPSQEGRGGMFKTAMQEDIASDPATSVLEYSDPILDSRWG